MLLDTAVKNSPMLMLLSFCLFINLTILNRNLQFNCIDILIIIIYYIYYLYLYDI